MKIVRTAFNNGLKVLKVHIQPTVSCFLWWLGGIITLGWNGIILLTAYGRTYKGHTPGPDETLVYLTALMFCIGTRKFHDCETNDTTDCHIPNDGLTGEFWYFGTILMTGLIFYDYFFPYPQIIAHIEKIPDQLFWTNVGVSSLLGVKFFKGWEALRTIVRKITKYLGV